MSQRIPIYIPTFISDQNYNPNRVLPRLFFFYGMVECEAYYIESGSLVNPGQTKEVTQFPYFDHYNVITGSFPTTGSRSLLFNNEAPVYGQQPNETLFNEYWSTYVELLYNPKTRLLNASAIIPLADYFDMELNDIVNWRGNYYHLRAINDYNLKTGECKIQLLGPIIADTFDIVLPEPVPPATVKIHLKEYNASPTAFFDLNVFANGESYFFSGDFSQSVAPNTSIVQMEVAQNSASQIWGPFLTASATMTITDNGSTIFNNTSTYTSGSAQYSVTSSVNFQSGHTYVISASNQPADCCTPTITSASISGGDISIFFTTASGCSGCTATTIERSVDGSTWTGSNTGGCTSPRVIPAPTSSMYYRIQQNCGAVSSSFSNSYYFVSGSSGSIRFDWNFIESGGARGEMELYINENLVENRFINSSGTYYVSVGDTIRCEVFTDECGALKANAYSLFLISDGTCANSSSVYTSPTYTVQSGDANLVLSMYASCDVGCV
jgi:hypothetical protein